jgi:hypothetical protein
MKNHVFIHTNRKQILGALVSKYTIERYSRYRDRFDVEILVAEDNAEMQRIFDQPILNEGKDVIYESNDLQSFTLARFLPPTLMNFSGRALVIDPDVFATYSDIWDLLGCDMGGNAILMKAHKPGQWATSVMLLDNAQLTHWRFSEIIDKLLAKQIDYRDQMSMRDEVASIGLLSEDWNSYDQLDSNTKLLHNTLRITQPWKTGLVVDFKQRKMRPLAGFIPREWVHTLIGRSPYRYREHPDARQIEFFFGHLKTALQSNAISEAVVANEVALKHVRQDAFKVLDRVLAL